VSAKAAYVARSMSGHQRPNRGATDVWLTPPEIIAAVGPFDLDPCAAVGQPWATATTHYTVEDDGLAQDWHGLVWCNPPFGPDAETWLRRLADHGHGIGLVPARTETRWFVSQVWKRADAVLFMHGRPHFHYLTGERGKANSGAPICLIAYGDQAVDRLATCGMAGSLVSAWRPSRAEGGASCPACGFVLSSIHGDEWWCERCLWDGTERDRRTSGATS
jgi:hypothetical protein